jgi:hypothetical protein
MLGTHTSLAFVSRISSLFTRPSDNNSQPEPPPSPYNKIVLLSFLKASERAVRIGKQRKPYNEGAEGLPLSIVNEVGRAHLLQRPAVDKRINGVFGHCTIKVVKEAVSTIVEDRDIEERCERYLVFSLGRAMDADVGYLG